MKAVKGEVNMGIGSDKENINDWVNNIWQRYNLKPDEPLNRYQLVNFTKNQLK